MQWREWWESYRFIASAIICRMLTRRLILSPLPVFLLPLLHCTNILLTSQLQQITHMRVEFSFPSFFLRTLPLLSTPKTNDDVSHCTLHVWSERRYTNKIIIEWNFLIVVIMFFVNYCMDSMCTQMANATHFECVLIPSTGWSKISVL